MSASRSARASSGSVSIVGSNPSAYAFSPASITIQAGDTVAWNNTSNAPEGHTVSGNGFDSGTLHQGQGYSHTFASPGSFSYFCAIHPSMKGTVTVQASSSGGGAGTSNSGAPPTTTTTAGSGSESAAGASPDAAGTSTQLPSTGIPLWPLLAGGGLLVALGALLRRRGPVS